jgi:G3E family GTPase
MHLLLITGFLGSGKTTFTINLSRVAVDAGQRVAILVNEIGEIGIDNQLMRQLDLNVWEMVNGCICCTLSADLVTTLQKLDADYQPDLVLLEPSGAAEPGNILQALRYYKGRPLESVRSVVILDPLRLPALFQVLTPLITKQMEHATLLLLNKTDIASDQELADTRRIAERVNPQAPVVALSAKEELEPWIITQLIPPRNER